MIALNMDSNVISEQKTRIPKVNTRSDKIRRVRLIYLCQKMMLGGPISSPAQPIPTTLGLAATLGYYAATLGYYTKSCTSKGIKPPASSFDAGRLDGRV